MCYIKDNNNVVADCLSRPICAATNVELFDLIGISKAQINDAEIDECRDRLSNV